MTEEARGPAPTPTPQAAPIWPLQTWDDESVFHDGDEFFADLMNGIARAEESIDLEVYIYENDEIGRAIAQLLIESARRGVRVRVMVDGVGSPGWLSHFDAKLTATGVETRVFHPLPWT